MDGFYSGAAQAREEIQVRSSSVLCWICDRKTSFQDAGVYQVGFKYRVLLKWSVNAKEVRLEPLKLEQDLTQTIMKWDNKIWCLEMGTTSWRWLETLLSQCYSAQLIIIHYLHPVWCRYWENQENKNVQLFCNNQGVGKNAVAILLVPSLQSTKAASRVMSQISKLWCIMLLVCLDSLSGI